MAIIKKSLAFNIILKNANNNAIIKEKIKSIKIEKTSIFLYPFELYTYNVFI